MKNTTLHTLDQINQEVYAALGLAKALQGLGMACTPADGNTMYPEDMQHAIFTIQDEIEAHLVRIQEAVTGEMVQQAQQDKQGKVGGWVFRDMDAADIAELKQI